MTSGKFRAANHRAALEARVERARWSAPSRLIVDSIVADLVSRNGLDHAWDSIDQFRDEIVGEWTELVSAILKQGT